MEKLFKMSDVEKKEYNLPIRDNYYFFKSNEELLGFAKINMLEKLDIYIFILEEKRGNGYGNELFMKVLENIKEYGIDSFEIKFPLNNVIMARIIEKNGGIEETRIDNYIKYIVFI